MFFLSFPPSKVGGITCLRPSQKTHTDTHTALTFEHVYTRQDMSSNWNVNYIDGNGWNAFLWPTQTKCIPCFVAECASSGSLREWNMWNLISSKFATILTTILPILNFLNSSCGFAACPLWSKIFSSRSWRSSAWAPVKNRWDRAQSVGFTMLGVQRDIEARCFSTTCIGFQSELQAALRSTSFKLELTRKILLISQPHAIHAKRKGWKCEQRNATK